MKNIITAIEKSRKNKKKLVIENLLNKIVIAKFAKVSSIIYLDNKYSWAISSIYIDVAKNLRLTDIKKY